MADVCGGQGPEDAPLRLPRSQLNHLPIHYEFPIALVMDSFRILLCGVGPCFNNFKNEEVELLDEMGIDHLAFEVGKAFGDQGWCHTLGGRRCQTKLLDLEI